MSEDVSGICGIIAQDLARTHVSYYNDDAKRIKGMYRQRIQKAWGHTAHRGWARLLLNRARDLIIHGPAHRGTKGAAMPTDEDDQDGHFFYNRPERGLLCCLGARNHCYGCLGPTHPTEGGGLELKILQLTPITVWAMAHGAASSESSFSSLKTKHHRTKMLFPK